HLLVKLLNVAHPFGWIHAIYVDGISWWRLIGPVGLLTLVPTSLRNLHRLNAGGSLREVQSHRAAPARVEKQEARALIEEKAEKPLERTNAGLVERLLARLLTPHERL